MSNLVTEVREFKKGETKGLKYAIAKYRRSTKEEANQSLSEISERFGAKAVVMLINQNLIGAIGRKAFARVKAADASDLSGYKTGDLVITKSEAEGFEPGQGRELTPQGIAARLAKCLSAMSNEKLSSDEREEASQEVPKLMAALNALQAGNKVLAEATDEPDDDDDDDNEIEEDDDVS